ncbi:MAG: hypothetical protein ITG02_01085 [Patulibacter sp.]|nr:hypothetical protein [Patulibacter sp.]
MIVPTLDAMHPVDCARRYGKPVAELLVAYRERRNALEQLAAQVDELLDTTPTTRQAGVHLVCELDETLGALR